MAIDMRTLYATTHGDPEAKLTVKRSWLKEVHRLLVEGASYKQRYENLRRELDDAGIEVTTTTIPPEARRDIYKGFDDINSGMGKIFGEDGAFDKIFGKGRRRGK